MATASDSTRLLGASVRGLTAAARNLGLAMTVGSAVAAAGLVGLAQSANRVSAAFREVDTISNDVRDAQREYGDLVSDLNTQFGLQADRIEVIDGLYQSVSAGIREGAEAQRVFLETAAQLAVVSQVDLATSVDVLSTVMNTYGMEVEQAQSVSTTLFETVQFGKVRMEELAPVLGRVAALGSEMDVQINEIATSMAVLTRTGFGARVAATGLRNIFRAMMRPSETMQSMLADIALENEKITNAWREQTEAGENIVQTYKNATDAVRELQRAEENARSTVEKHSLKIQEARLKIQAIEEDRLDQLGELSDGRVREADTVEELNEIIEDYRFKVNKARVAEEKSRQEREKKQQLLKDLRKDFKKNVDMQGNLEDSVGSLVLGNQKFTETLVQLRKRADEQNIAFSELFPRTRALQGALALVGEDGELLTEIFQQMQNDAFNAREEWDDMSESTQENFDNFQDFKEATQELDEAQLEDLFEEARGNSARMRDAVAELKEVVQDLGAIFSEDVVDAIQTFADSVQTIEERASDLREGVQENISRFAILATTLGLVLGPLLFFGGQIALIAQTMGVAFVPFLGIAGTLVGVLASTLSRVLDPLAGMQTLLSETPHKGFLPGQDEASDTEILFIRIRNVISELFGFMRRMKQLFVDEVLPPMIDAGHAFMGVIGAIGGQMGDAMSDDELTPFETLAQMLGTLFRVIADFLNENADTIAQIFVVLGTQVASVVSDMGEFVRENEELIKSLLTMAVDVLANRVIPNLVDFATGLFDVLGNVDPRPFIIMGMALLELTLRFTDFLGAVGRFMTEHQALIGSFVTWAGVILSVVYALGFLAPIFSAIGTFIGVISTAVSLFGAWGLVLGPVLGLFQGFAFVVAQLAALFPTLTAGLGLIATGLKIVGGFILSVIGTTGVLIGILVALAAIVWIVRDEIVAAFLNTVDILRDVASTLWDAIVGDISWKEAGKRITERIAEGITDQIQIIKDAAKTLTSTITDYLPSSPAKTGPLAKQPPKESGKTVAKDFASGIGEGMPNVEGKMGELPKIPENAGGGSDFAFGDSSTGFGGGMGGDEITIEEKAIYFAKGAFQGISDEELPEKVRDEVEEVLEEDVIEKIEGRGQGSPVR